MHGLLYPVFTTSNDDNITGGGSVAGTPSNFLLLFFDCRFSLNGNLRLLLHHSCLFYITSANRQPRFSSHVPTFSTGQLPSFLRSTHLLQTGRKTQPHMPVDYTSDGLLGFHWEGQNFKNNLLHSSSSCSFYMDFSEQEQEKTHGSNEWIEWIAGSQCSFCIIRGVGGGFWAAVWIRF